MAELISLILSKPEWQTKMANSEIVGTWRQEIVAQGINPKIFDCILALLQDYKKSTTSQPQYHNERNFDWDVKLGVNLKKDLMFECKCECLCCTEGVNSDDDSEEDDDEEEDEKQSEWTKSYMKDQKRRKLLTCLCTEEKRDALFSDFLDKFLVQGDGNFVVPDLKANLVANIAKLEKSTEAVDYHPGSNNQVIDLVHPSLYCYVKGVSQTQNVGSALAPATDAVFQWLPAEFKVERNADHSVKSVSIDSYINNLPRESNAGLYDSIGQVFGKMVPQFDELLATLHTSDRLQSPTDEPITLSDCQVIVKLANIVIAPGENASFPGGHWHLEGMKTERIVATGIYYYDMTNVAPNCLNFRSTIDDVHSVPYPQNGTSSVFRHFAMNELDNDRNMETVIDVSACLILVVFVPCFSCAVFRANLYGQFL